MYGITRAGPFLIPAALRQCYKLVSNESSRMAGRLGRKPGRRGSQTRRTRRKPRNTRPPA